MTRHSNLPAISSPAIDILPISLRASVADPNAKPRYMLAKKSDLGIAHELGVSDLHVEVIDLLNNRVEGEIGLGFFVAAILPLHERRQRPKWQSSH